MKSYKSLSIIGAAAVALAGIGLSSCASDLDLKNPDAYDFSSFYKTQEQFEGNVTAIMNQWRGSVFTPQMTFYAGDLRSGVFETSNYLDGSALMYSTEVANALTSSYTQFSNYNGIYGVIANINTFLYYSNEKSSIFDPAALSYMQGMMYGMRAYCYFVLHKMYGVCPMELTPDVVLGETSLSALQKKQSPASEVVAQIKSDIKASLDCFNAGSSYSNSTFNASSGVYYWTKAATEMLAGEAYLWFGKVSTGDYTADASCVTTAQTYLQSVIDNYSKSLQSNYYDIWRTKANNEVIFAAYYERDETTWNYRYVQPTLFVTTTGLARGRYWWTIADPSLETGFSASGFVGADKLLPRTTTATRFGYNTEYPDNSTGQALFQVMPSNQNECQVKNAYVRQFSDDDQRSLMLIKAYLVTDAENGLDADNDSVTYIIEDFDAETATMAGAFIYKFPGQSGSNSPYQIVGGNDHIYYRLAMTYMLLAEAANYNSDWSTCAKCINEVRKRAYGDNWDEATYGYAQSSNFKDNEVAILQEKAKEFLFEGQRWFDLRRMTTVKGGTAEDHLIFQPEGCIGYGLDSSKFKCPWNEVAGDWDNANDPNNQIVTNVPVLNFSTQANQVLWPLAKTMLDQPNNLDQTEGY